MKVFSEIILTVLILVLGGLGLVYFSPDYNIYIVRSDSMKPVFSGGDMVVTGPVNGELKPGMIITYELGKSRTTHRIISVDDKAKTLVTKGDANEDRDPWPVAMSEVKGNYLFHIPYIGYLTSFAQTKNGWFLSIIVPAMLLVLFIVIDIIKESLIDPVLAQEEVIAKMLAKYWR